MTQLPPETLPSPNSSDPSSQAQETQRRTQTETQ